MIIGHDWVATMYDLTQQNMQEDQGREGDLVLDVDRENQATEFHDLSNDLVQEHNLIEQEKIFRNSKTSINLNST